MPFRGILKRAHFHYFLLILLPVFSCRNSSPIRVAVMTKLESGSAVGSSEINASRLFVEERGAKELEIVPFDDGWESEKTKAVFSKVIGQGIRFLITSHTSACAIAIRDAINQSGILTFVTGATTNELSGLDDWIFRDVPDVRVEQAEMAKYVNGLGYRSVLIIRDTDNEAYTSPASEIFRASLSPSVRVEAIDQSMSSLDFADLEIRIRSVDFDFLYLLIGGYKTAAGAIGQLAVNIKPEVRFMFTPWMRTPVILETTGQAISHATMPSNYPPKGSDERIDAFLMRFKERFGYTPNITSLNVHKALEILLEAVRAGNRDPASVRAYILKKRKMRTDFGEVAFDEYGDVIAPFYFITDIRREF